jgi:hypothetical protein
MDRMPELDGRGLPVDTPEVSGDVSRSLPYVWDYIRWQDHRDHCAQCAHCERGADPCGLGCLLLADVRGSIQGMKEDAVWN